VYLINSFCRSFRNGYTQYYIDGQLTSTATRIIFVHRERDNQKLCLKLLLPCEDDLYHTNDPVKCIKYLLEGLNYNRRFTHGVYLGVASVETMTESVVVLGPLMRYPKVNSLDQNVEYALVMIYLDENLRLDKQLSADKLGTQVGITSLAREIAKMHKKIKPPARNIDIVKSIVGKLAKNRKIHETALQKLSNEGVEIEKYNKFDDLFEEACTQLRHLFQRRYDEGMVKRCHGDLKSTNLWAYSNKWSFGRRKIRLLALDCIDFDDEFCYIDTLSDLAMLLVDIEMLLNGQADSSVNGSSTMELTTVFLDVYLHEMHECKEEILPILEYYMVEKSIVCAYMSILYDNQLTLGEKYLKVGLDHADILEELLKSSGKALPTKRNITFSLDVHSK
jgi:aminoglycoside phosphotransferase family enzyme